VLDPVSACELAVNFALVDDILPLASILARPGIAEARVARMDAYGGGDWEEDTRLLSDRVVDLVFDAALKGKRTAAALAALEAGADSNAAIWNLERSYNEHLCALSYAIDHNMPEVVEALLQAGARPEGTSYGGLNQPLFHALYRGRDELADRLLARGAALPLPSPSQYRRFYGCLETELRAICHGLGRLIPLVQISTKPSLHVGGGQGGSWRALLNVIANGNDVARLRKYEALGMETTLSGEEIDSLIHADAWDSLAYFLGKYGEATRDRAFFWIRRKYPKFGAVSREAETLPQNDGINLFDGERPEDDFALALPDGSKILVWLDAIAPAGHDLGACLPGEIFVQKVDAEFRRRRDRVVMRKLSRTWERMAIPQNRYQLDDLLPCLREIDGRCIWLGLTVRHLQYRFERLNFDQQIREWLKSDSFGRIQALAQERIAAQAAANQRPPIPTLTVHELTGYPREFWPFLVRLPDGLIGMTKASSRTDADLLTRYRDWEVKSKPDATFVPDPRVSAWEGWPHVPEDLKPFFIFDTLIDRPSVRYNAANEYEEAMIRKAVRWWNEDWMMPAIRQVLEQQPPAD
jgi:hypothetical protein